jgi:peptide/nickel transport system permease protein
MAAIGSGLMNVIVAIGIAAVPLANRIVRSVVLAEKRTVYVEAARASGCGEPRILFRHILPNVTAPVVVVASLTLGNAILSEAALTFLGVGTPASIPSWGEMLSHKGRMFMLAQPWMAIGPGLAITLAVLGWNLLGDAVRDVWDPRLRGE